MTGESFSRIGVKEKGKIVRIGKKGYDELREKKDGACKLPTPPPLAFSDKRKRRTFPLCEWGGFYTSKEMENLWFGEERAVSSQFSKREEKEGRMSLI